MKSIYSLLEKGFIRYLLNKNSAKISKDNLTFIFLDLDGNPYYEFPKQMALPMERLAKMKEYVMWLSAGLDAQELDFLLDQADKALTEGVRTGKGASTIGFLIREMKDRKKMVIHDELFYNFIAVNYVRGDEDPTEFNSKIQLEKVEAFKRLNKHSDGFFLTIQPYLKVLSLSNTTYDQLKELLNDSVIRRDALRKMLTESENK